jgi:hypothetical protein
MKNIKYQRKKRILAHRKVAEVSRVIIQCKRREKRLRDQRDKLRKELKRLGAEKEKEKELIVETPPPNKKAFSYVEESIEHIIETIEYLYGGNEEGKEFIKEFQTYSNDKKREYYENLDPTDFYEPDPYDSYYSYYT